MLKTDCYFLDFFDFEGIFVFCLSSFFISASLFSTTLMISCINPSKSLSEALGSTASAISVIVDDISALTSSKLSGSSYAVA